MDYFKWSRFYVDIIWSVCWCIVAKVYEITKITQNTKFMKKLLTIALLSAGLTIALLSCKSDYDKYQEMMNEASDSPVTEIVTPDGLNFNMNKDEYNSYIDSLPHKEFNYRTYWLFKVENEVYAADFSTPKFYEGKLCSYAFYIEERVSNNTLKNLFVDDFKKIVVYYQKALGEDSKSANLPESWPEFDTYVLTKGNLTVEITRSHYSGGIKVICENKPAAINVQEEKDYGSSYTSKTPSAEVKNNKWNGGVKQVEDYLERTLRDPDSYESIEWSEVKQKDDGYYVRHKYRAKNGIGGMVVTNQLFHLDFSGNVVDVKDLY